MSNNFTLEDIDKNNELRKLVRDRIKHLKEDSYSGIISMVKKQLLLLREIHKEQRVETRELIKTNFGSKECQAFFNGEITVEEVLITVGTISEFIGKNHKTSSPQGKSLDFYCVFIGYAGGVGFNNGTSLIDCFQINKAVDKYSQNGEDGFKVFLNRNEELQNLRKIERDEIISFLNWRDNKINSTDVIIQKLNELKNLIQQISVQSSKFDKKHIRDKSFLDSILYNLEKITKSRLSNENLDNALKKIEESYKKPPSNLDDNYSNVNNKIRELINEVKKNKGKTQITIPVLKPKWHRRLFWKIGFKNWVYHFNNDKELPLKKQEFSPFGYNKTTLRRLTKHYISTDYKLGTFFSDDKNKENKKDVLTELYKQTIQHPNDNNFKYFFILADSGIGKTTLLVKLFLKARAEYSGKNKIYILPFAQRHLVYDFSLKEKQNGILLLDAIDEDFSLGKKEDIKIDEFRENTQDFNKVVITSRDTFFRNSINLEDFVDETGSIENEGYQTFSLCPFDNGQIIEFFKNKFYKNKKDYNKALKIKDYIGDDVIQRQLLIANIENLFTILDDKNKLKEAKGYQLFECMLENWRVREKKRVKGIVHKAKDVKVLAFEETMTFCKVLARGFLEMEQRDYFGFSWKELREKFPEIDEFDKTSLLVNRTFLILDSYNQYRFAHSSILDFFLAQIAVEDEVFDSEYFQKSPYTIENNFANEMYKQGVTIKINEIIKNENINDIIRFTTVPNELFFYVYEIRFAPYFIIDNEKQMKPYLPKPWNSFSKLKENISRYKEIQAIKFINEIGNQKFNKRRECLDLILPMLRFFSNLGSIDLADMNLTDEEVPWSVFSESTVLNLRNNKIKNGVSTKVKNPLIVNLVGNDCFIPLSKIKSLNTVLNYSKILFSSLLEETRYSLTKHSTFSLSIFLSHEDLEKGKEHLDNVNKIRVLSKICNFSCNFFTEDKLLTEQEIIDCFPDVQRNKLKTDNIEYFNKTNNYLNYVDKEGIILRKGVCKGFNDTIFSKYPNSFPIIEDNSIELETPKTDLIPHKLYLDIIKTNIRKGKIRSLNLHNIYTGLSLVILREHLLKSNIITLDKSGDSNFSSKFLNTDGLKLTETGYLLENDIINNNIDEFGKLNGILKNGKHIILFNYKSPIVYRFLAKDVIESLFINVNSVSNIFKVSFDFFTNFLELKRLGVNLSFNEESIQVDFIKIPTLKKLEEFTLASRNKNIKIENLNILINSKTIKNLVLDFPYEKKSNNESNSIFEIAPSISYLYAEEIKNSNQKKVNNTIEKLTIRVDLINLISANKIQFTSLTYLKIVDIYKGAIEGLIDTGFIFNLPSLKELIIPLFFKFDLELIKIPSLERLYLTLSSPFDKKIGYDLGKIINVIKNIPKVKIAFIIDNFDESIENYSEDAICSLFNKLELLSGLELCIKFNIGQIKERTGISENNISINLRELFEKKVLKINIANDRLRKKIPRYSSFFEKLLNVIGNKYEPKVIMLNGVKLSLDFLRKRTLNIHLTEPKFSVLKENYFNEIFLNKEKQILVNNPDFDICLIPYKHIRFIDLTITKGFLITNSEIFKYVKKISITYITKDLLYNILMMGCFENLIEVELLAYQMPLDERTTFVERETNGVKYTINTNKLEIKNANKGLFESEVVN